LTGCCFYSIFLLGLKIGGMALNLAVSRTIIDSNIVIKKEVIFNVFTSITGLYNKQDKYRNLEFTRSEFWELLCIDGKMNSEYLAVVIKELTRSDTFEITSKNVKISGSMFIIAEEDNKIIIEIPTTFHKYVFFKTDIDIIANRKKYLTPSQLEHWDNHTSNKYTKSGKTDLLLLKKTDLLGLKGKYTKRLYTLLMKSKNPKKLDTGKLIIKYDDFKERLEIPKSYKASNIDQKILSPAKTELLKANIKITKITKIKKGRAIDIIEILFKISEPKKSKIKTNKPTNILINTNKPANKRDSKESKLFFKIANDEQLNKAQKTKLQSLLMDYDLTLKAYEKLKNQ
jgi:hypothetical protein